MFYEICCHLGTPFILVFSRKPLGNKRVVKWIKEIWHKLRNTRLKAQVNKCELELFPPMHKLAMQFGATTLVTTRKGYACIKSCFSALNLRLLISL